MSESSLQVRSDPKPKEFSDLNIDVLKVIIDELNLKDRLVLRKVSRGLRSVVDQQRSILKRIDIYCLVDHIFARFGFHEVIYADPKFNLNEFADLYLCDIDNHLKNIKGVDYLKIALDDLEFAFKDPKLQLYQLRIKFFSHFIDCGRLVHDHLDRFSQHLEAILKSVNYPISTKAFEIRAESADYILSILPYLKPSTLSRIEFIADLLMISDKKFDKIAELEQWKQAKVLDLRYASRMWPEKHLMNFEEFIIFVWNLDAEEIRRWRDIFSRSENFITCEMYAKEGFIPEQIQNHICEEVPTLVNYFPDPVYVIKHLIRDDPNQYLEITVRPWANCIVFKKLPRQSS